MGVRPWLILAAVALARIGFGYQYQTVATLGPQLVRQFDLDYATLGTLIGAYMLLGGFLALPLGSAGPSLRRSVWCSVGGLALMVLGPLVSVTAAGPTGIGIGRSVAGVGAVAMIVLQNKIIADWFTGRLLHVGDQHLRRGLSDRRRPRAACAATAGAGVWLAGRLPVRRGADGGRPGHCSSLSFRPVATCGARRARSRCRAARECLLLMIAGLIWTAYTAGYSAYTGLCSVGHGGSWRGAGADRTGTDHRDLGECAGHHARRRACRRFGALRIFLLSTLALWSSASAGPRLLDWPVSFARADRHRGVVSSGRDHGGRHAVSAAGEPRRRDGAVLFDVLRRAAPWCRRSAVERLTCTADPEGALLAAAGVSALAIPMYLLHRRCAG